MSVNNIWYIIIIAIYIINIYDSKYILKFKNIFNNQIVNTVIFFMIANCAIHDVLLSILLTISFIHIIHVINDVEIKETFEQTKQLKEIEHFTNSIMDNETSSID